MNLSYSAETEPFRLEVRDWVSTLIARIRAESTDPRDVIARWQAELYATGWSVPTWPTRYGGRGLSAVQYAIALEEIVAAGAPLPRATGGELLVGPTILHWGTDEQKDRFLPLIAHGEQSWCQGFSEPDSGSDLASLQTTAVQDGDEWLLNGHKIWTSEADSADLMFTLAVSSPEATRRHDRITYFLVPLDQPGVEVRPIVQPDGRAGFTEVLLTDARCPSSNILGQPGDGWRVAMGTLGIERGVNPVANHHRWETELGHVLDAARANGRVNDPAVRQRLVQAWIDVQLLKLNGFRLLTAAINGSTEWGVDALQATNKFRYTEFHQRLCELSVDVLGPDGQLLTGELGAPSPPGVGMGLRTPYHDYPASDVQATYLFSLASTIYGGTSQIQRNIVAERVLGMPR